MVRKEQKEEKPKVEQEKLPGEEASDRLAAESTGTSETGEQEDVKIQLEQLNDKYVRLYSDFDNYRKRTIKEKADVISSASEGVVKELLTVLDDFDRAAESNDKVNELDNVKEGFRLIHHKLQVILQSKGLEKMEAKGEPFDPEKHEAVTNIPAGDELKGKVVDVVECGYKLNGKPIRYAKVVVGQ